MTGNDQSAILARAGLWATELRELGQLDDTAASRLNETLADSFGERLDRQDDPLLVVMLCGPTAVGKSSLINALAGAEISRPGLGAATRAAVLYVHEKDDPARLFEYSIALGRDEQRETQLVRHRCDELLHKVLVDTPDIDSVMMQHRELTARLVHAADIVLFVTSPEKYKVMHSARWVLQQRQQRAMAFILNKWDRAALGLQSGRRAEIAADFRRVLANEGFPDALVFKVSSLSNPLLDQDDVDDGLPALRSWLELGISQSTAAIIRRRRLRAAWGRLAATIEQALPRPLSGHPLLPDIQQRLSSCGGMVEQSLVNEAAILEATGLEENGWPNTPGLLGMWTRVWQRIGSTTASLRAGFASLSGRTGSREDLPGQQAMFGARSTRLLSETIQQIDGDVADAHMALGPVTAAWASIGLGLAARLSLLPLDIAAELAARANRRSLRQVVGTTCVYAVEGLILLVLLVTIYRIGSGFIVGSSAPEGLLGTVAALVFILLIIGHTVAAVFFPPLRQRLRRTVAQRARALAKAAIARAQSDLREQVEAVDRLARQGREMLSQIDQSVIALATETSDTAEVNRLFGEQTLRLTADVATPRSDAEALQVRRPTFD